MFTTDLYGTEVTIPGDRYVSNTQGFTYNQKENCVMHHDSPSMECIPLPDHFNGTVVRAIAQVWNSATAGILES